MCRPGELPEFTAATVEQSQRLGTRRRSPHRQCRGSVCVVVGRGSPPSPKCTPRPRQPCVRGRRRGSCSRGLSSARSRGHRCRGRVEAWLRQRHRRAEFGEFWQLGPATSGRNRPRFDCPQGEFQLVQAFQRQPSHAELDGVRQQLGGIGGGLPVRLQFVPDGGVFQLVVSELRRWQPVERHEGLRRVGCLDLEARLVWLVSGGRGSACRYTSGE
mmetsp:Transcript_95897/g.310909  ORF Transcript_95897/g.310909 Transcript_95897/m.310909 type:complete len:215 (+) Transcript_95897:154-798(+)